MLRVTMEELIELFRFSRSHQTSLRRCPREGLLRYWWDGTGYTRAGISIELGTGSLFHDTMGEILEYILNTSIETGLPQVAAPADVIRQAVLNQRMIYETTMSAAVNEIVQLGMAQSAERAGWSKTINRQATLAEAMVRCWLIVRLPYFLQNYSLIAVEGEEESEISPGIIFMQRKDSVWQHNDNGTMHAMEFKTSGNNTLNFLNSWQYDLQQITHLLNFRGKYAQDPKSVLVEIAYKGRKYGGENVGALVSGYKKEHLDIITHDPVDIEYDWVYGRCKTKGWKKFWIADEDFGDGVKSPAEVWLNEVLDYETCRDHCLDTEITHNPKRIERWLNQTRREMTGVRDGLVQLAQATTPEEVERLCDVLFPALEEKDSCAPYFGSKACTFQSVCHGQDDMFDLYQTQGFKPREPHHPGELKEKNDATTPSG